MTFTSAQLAAANRTLGIARDYAIEALNAQPLGVDYEHHSTMLINQLDRLAGELGYRLEPVRREDDEGSD